MRTDCVGVRTASAALLALLVGCATVDPRADYGRAAAHVATATGVRPEPPADEAAIGMLVAGILEHGLTADETVRLCLLNNPRVRAAWLRIGVARADVVQAGLFKNPGLSLALRFPDGGGLGNLDLAIAQNIAELWLMPVRKRAAESELERTLLHAAGEISAAAIDTRAAYFRALGLEREQAIAVENRDVANQLFEAVTARQQSGAGNTIDVNLARAELMQTELAVRTAALDVLEARRGLAVLLGLSTPPEELRLTDRLPDPPGDILAPEELLAGAAGRRLDLLPADQAVGATQARWEQERRSVLTDVEVGVGFEREQRGRRGDRPWLADTLWASAEAGAPAAPSLRPRESLPTDTILGPTLSLEVPIFDQGQARIARAAFLHEQAVLEREALRLDVAQETRAAAQRARTAWDVALYYRNEFLPLLQSNLDLARTAYRGGKLSLLSVLEAQKLLLASRARYVQALRDAALAVTELERAIGAPLEPPAAPDSHPPAAPTSAPAAPTSAPAEMEMLR